MAAVWERLRANWAGAQHYQRLLYVTGGLLVLSAGFHLLILIATGGALDGAVSWRKPVLFGEAFGLTAISLGWVMTYLPKRRVIGWAVAATLALSTTYEVVWVSVQQWRGVPSHFNYSTPFDETAFNLAGAMIGLTALAALAVTLWSLFALAGPPSLRLAIRSGLLLLLASQGFGFAIIQNGNAKVFDRQTGAYLPEAVDEAAVFGEAGEMKLPHALSVHAIQLLPALAGVTSLSNRTERRRWWTVLAGVIGYAGLVGLSASQTFRGRPLFDLSPLGWLWLGLAVGGLIAAAAGALVGAGRPQFWRRASTIPPSSGPP